jgi:hypothetical protein
MNRSSKSIVYQEKPIHLPVIRWLVMEINPDYEGKIIDFRCSMVTYLGTIVLVHIESAVDGLDICTGYVKKNN